ncbi:MAG: DUF5060 domain-containing protein, partial [Flavobacterium sp.]|nr:DUF5060 domain-containing protein [Flavobacterium sp.]
MKQSFLTVFLILVTGILFAQTPIWTKHEIAFQSSKTYDNPIYDVKDFKIIFTAPSGRNKLVRGFWDGGTDWKVRFMPDETGNWSWKTECSDKENSGLHNQSGTFDCITNKSNELL